MSGGDGVAPAEGVRRHLPGLRHRQRAQAIRLQGPGVTLTNRVDQDAADKAAKEDADTPGRAEADSKKGLVGQVVGNASFLTAALVYMGWAYENSLLEHFNVSALSLNISVQQYVLKSLNVFFQRNIFFGVAALAFVIAAVNRFMHGNNTGKTSSTMSAHQDRRLVWLGVVMLIVLAWLGSEHDWFARISGVFYILLALLATGLLLLAWPGRGNASNQFPYALAIVVAAGCALWIAGDYAAGLGSTDAENFTHQLPSVSLYSTQPLNLTGRGVACKAIPGTPVGSQYRYRCVGLYLLYNQAGTAYYLLPADWKSKRDPTYIIGDSDQIRVEFYSR
jgi:hypothetical protein